MGDACVLPVHALHEVSFREASVVCWRSRQFGGAVAGGVCPAAETGVCPAAETGVCPAAETGVCPAAETGV